jgi:hypothetical protein
MLLDFNPGEDGIVSFNLPIVIVIQQGNSIQNRFTCSCSLLGLEVFGMTGFCYPIFESNLVIDQRLFGRSSGFVATTLDVFQEFLACNLSISGMVFLCRVHHTLVLSFIRYTTLLQVALKQEIHAFFYFTFQAISKALPAGAAKVGFIN